MRSRSRARHSSAAPNGSAAKTVPYSTVTAAPAKAPPAAARQIFDTPRTSLPNVTASMHSPMPPSKSAAAS